MTPSDNERRMWRGQYSTPTQQIYDRHESKIIIRLLDALEQSERGLGQIVAVHLAEIEALAKQMEQAEGDRDSWKAQYLLAIGQPAEANECEHGQGD